MDDMGKINSIGSNIKKHLLSIVIILGLVLALISPVMAEINEEDSYKVGVNDVISIKVLDHPNLQSIVSVSSDGSISFPYLGTVHVKGMSISEIEQEITKKLSEGYVKFPVVTVSLRKSMSRKIYTYGAISKRGQIAYDENMRLLQALSIAGGLTPDGQYGKLKVRRKQKKSPGYKDIVIDLDSTIENSNIEDMLLLPDDIIIVESNKTFLIQGEVQVRGRTVLEHDMTVLRAILQAGGVHEKGRYGKVKLRRKLDDKSNEYKDIAESNLIDGVIADSEVEDMILQPDDILIVEQNKTFLIQGEVAGRGRKLLESDMTVLRALSEAGGVTENGRYGKVIVRRKQEGETGEYKDIAEAPLNDGIIYDRSVEDMILKPEDILLVERNGIFYIYGEINRTGEGVLKNDMTVFQAITIAGGFTKWGAGNRVKILRPRADNAGFEILKVNIEDVLDGDASADVYLKHGDIIVVSTGIF